MHLKKVKIKNIFDYKYFQCWGVKLIAKILNIKII